MNLSDPIPNLVFIHGFGGGPEDWAPLRRCLGAEFGQVAITLPGHGIRKGDSRPFHIERCATEVIEAIGQAPAILIGHSMGSRIAIEAACRRPDLIAGLALVDGSNAPADPSEVADAYSARVAELGFDKAMDWTLSSMLVEGLCADTQRRMYVRIRALPPETAMEYEISMAKWDRDRFRACLISLGVPVKVIQSTSLIPSRGWARKPVSEAPNSLWLDAWQQVASANISIIKGCGHYVMIENPAGVSEAVTTLLAITGAVEDTKRLIPQ